MEILTPTPYLSSTNWFLEETKSTTKWTAAENKAFENALAVYDKDTPYRWQRVAAMIPGKTESDVIKQYRELEADVSNIEAGLVPIPGYIATSPFTLDWVGNNGRGCDGFKRSYTIGSKRSLLGRQAEQERKKGVPWTEEEHKLFLMGLKKYGKGDWRNISRNFVISRTPTQVASHAQKYFIRQLSGGKDKRRASIHDITTVNLDDEARTPLSENKSCIKQEQPTSGCLPRNDFPWNQMGNRITMDFNSTQGNVFGMHTYGFKMQGENLQGGCTNNDSYYGAKNMVFQL